jgi:undecaprenyl-diphosphatase
MIDFLTNLDSQLFLFLNGLHSEFWDSIMWWVSGKEEWIPLYMVILGWLIFRFKWRILYLIPFIVLLIVLSDQISVLIKNTVQRFRPTHDPEIGNLVNTLNNYRGGKFGFVSSHAANSFALAIFTSLILKNKWFTVFIFFWAALVSYSRIYLGVHYPGDILFGALLGIALGMVTFWLWNISNEKIFSRKSNN